METERQIPKLWEHQQKAVNLASGKNYFALFMDPGTGKSASLTTILRNIYNREGDIVPTIILCPLVVIKNWKKEILMWSKIPESKVILVTGTTAQKLEAIENAPALSILVTNYETLIQEKIYSLMESHLFLGGNSCLVLDESHRCKTHNSKRTKVAIRLAKLAKYRFILTGTPILNSIEDLFSQFHILDHGKRFGSNYYAFKHTYFKDMNRGMPQGKYFPNWKALPGAESKIKELIQDTSFFAKKEECLSLPPLIKKVIEVEMSKEQARLYESMKRDLVATINTPHGEKHSIAELAITKALRLQQIVSGHLRVENEGDAIGTIKIKDNPRKAALTDLLEDLVPHSKVLVWAVFHANYDDIRDTCDRLGVSYAELHGKANDRDAQIDRFNNDNECRVLIGHPGSGGIGVNLVAASYSIFYSRSFSLEFDIQAEARNYRGGSERHTSITRIDLVTPGTIDELVMKSLAQKQQLSDKVLKAHLEEI